jgi:hypothetical protein
MQKLLASPPLLGWAGKGGRQKNVFTAPRTLFSGALDGGILFKIVLQELHVQWLIYTEGEMNTVLVGKPEGRRPLVDLDVDGRKIIK